MNSWESVIFVLYNSDAVKIRQFPLGSDIRTIWRTGTSIVSFVVWIVYFQYLYRRKCTIDYVGDWGKFDWDIKTQIVLLLTLFFFLSDDKKLLYTSMATREPKPGRSASEPTTVHVIPQSVTVSNKPSANTQQEVLPSQKIFPYDRIAFWLMQYLVSLQNIADRKLSWPPVNIFPMTVNFVLKHLWMVENFDQKLWLLDWLLQQ